MTQYVAIEIRTDGREGSRMEFEYDPTAHESYSAIVPRTGGIYLTLDAPGVADFARRVIGGYIECAGPLADGDPLLICDEDGEAKDLPRNHAHPLTAAWFLATGRAFYGPVVAIREA